MLLSSAPDCVLDAAAQQVLYPEISGRRVLITGITESFGFDLARTFAEAGARLVLNVPNPSEAQEIFCQSLGFEAQDISIHTQKLGSIDAIVSFARTASQVFGGVDIVINIAELEGAAELAHGVDAGSGEGMVSDLLLPTCLVSRVAANRMRLTLTEGLVLNIATIKPASSSRQRAFAQLAKVALAQMTRREAESWAANNIRFNAIAPQVEMRTTATCGSDTSLVGEMDVAALAMYLASGRGQALNGHTFEAEPLPVMFQAA